MAFRFLIGFLAMTVLAFASEAGAQQARSTTQPQRAGTWRSGKFIGFVPAHEKHNRRRDATAGNSAATTASETPAEAAPAAVTEQLVVEPVAFQQPAEESLLTAPVPTGEAVQDPATNDEPFLTETPFLGEEVYFSDPGCCNNPLWWGSAEFLLWRTSSVAVPALATSGDPTDPLPGAIGQPGTQVLFGDTGLNDSARPGGRFTIGKWLDDCRTCGIEVTYLTLGEESESFSGSNFDFDVLARPFFNTVTMAQDARLIAEPGTVSGTLDIEVATEFQTFELLYRKSCQSSWFSRIDWLVGYRAAELNDRVGIHESTLSLAGISEGTTIDLFDEFDTRSTFHGGEMGLVLHWLDHPCWSWELGAKVALGGTSFRGNVAGQRTATDNTGNVSTAQGGLLALGTNSGTFRWDEFGAMSEAGVVVRRKLACGLTASFGYTLIHWSNVARAAEQIDTTINPTQIPPDTLDGEPRPEFPFTCSDFTAQGLRFGLEYNF